MPTESELFQVVVLPLLISAITAALGSWRGWAWAFPLGAGIAFFVAYWMVGRPAFPPADATDWLFWAAIPIALLAGADALLGGRWAWLGCLLGAAMTAGIALLLLRPLVSMPAETKEFATIAIAAVGAVIVLGSDVLGRRSHGFWTAAALAIVAGGAGVVIFSSGSRTIGLHGLALAAAVGPVALLGSRACPPRTIAAFVAPLLVGLLMSGRFYASVTILNFWMLAAAPALLLLGAAVPGRRGWVRGLIALLGVAIAVAAIATPAALAAKRAAEGDGSVDYYK